MSLSPQKQKELHDKLQTYIGIDAGSNVAPDHVNEPMIRHWCAVMGDENPVYRDPDAAKSSVHGDLVAPPTMLNAWTMPAYIPPWADPDAPPHNKEVELHQLLTSYGYTGVVATDHDQTFERYLEPGDHVTATMVIESISEEKSTPLGVGFFIDVVWTFRDQNDEVVGNLHFRTLKYRPAQQPQPVADAGPGASSKPTRLPAPMGHDNSWWWDGVERGEILIQRCKDCGVLRHPPAPMCGQCQSIEWDFVASAGVGRVYSFTILHHPKVPGYDYPLAVALIELEEGTRLVANVVDCKPDELHIGMPVEGSIEQVDEANKLPVFRPARG